MSKPDRNKAEPSDKDYGVGASPGRGLSNTPGLIQSGGIHIIRDDDDRRQCLHCGAHDHETRNCE